MMAEASLAIEASELECVFAAVNFPADGAAGVLYTGRSADGIPNRQIHTQGAIKVFTANVINKCHAAIFIAFLID